MNSPSASPSLLGLSHIVKNYPGVRAVDDVSLDFLAGEVHGLVGENGAGKSTLIKILAGAVEKESGEIRLHGRPVEVRHVHDAARHGLAFIHQELNLVPYFDAAENIFLGQAYPRRALGRVDWRDLRRRAKTILARLGADLPLGVPVSRLSSGQQTIISIAHAFAADAQLIVMDEPSAALTDQEIEHLFAVIRTLKTEGVTVVYVSHRLREIFAIADRVTVMRSGRVVATAAAATLDEPALVQLMTGRAVESVYPPRQGNPGETLLSAAHLTGDYCRDITFTLRCGEVLGVAGLMGAGRSELLKMLFGVAPIRSGEITLHAGARSTSIHPRSPSEAFGLGLALTPEERRSQGLVLTRPIFENTTLTFLRRFARGGWLLDRSRELAITARLGQQLGLRSANLRQPVGQLSGGNQQKVVFARCLAGDVQVLLLDEPTRGVDVGAKQEIYHIIRTLTAQGAGVILVSSELSEVLGLADRVLVLREGCQVATLAAAGAGEEAVLRYCYGLENMDNA